ncbi:MAG: hypothetical protein ACI936_003254 [Paraglaciecola sp.]|jgi:hypothetical protein
MMYLFLAFCILFIASFVLVLKKKNIDVWFIPYLKGVLFRPTTKSKKHVMFCFVDHYEPQWGNVSGIEQERFRVDRWHNEYPVVAGKHMDSDGVHPQHSFFYPEEEYRYEHLAKISDLCARGFGEIEVHLHHEDDTSDNLRKTLERFTTDLHEKHGAFTYNQKLGKYNYSFIHGNWSLCNSRKDGKLCGVNDELIILKETGCYADYTYPSAPSDTQTSKINSIYYATDKPGQSKSHDDGVDVEVDGKQSGDLMIIQGPLALNFKRLKKKIFPQIENADVRRSMPPTNDRVDLWVKTGVQVKNKPEWIFIKIHTHGTQEGDMDTLLGKPFDDMCSYLESKYNDGKDYALHYVSAREMYNIVKAAEAGETSNPNSYRDYVLAKPTHKHLKDHDFSQYGNDNAA